MRKGDIMQQNKMPDMSSDPLAAVESILRGETAPPPVPTAKPAEKEAVHAENAAVPAEDEEKAELPMTAEEKVAEMLAMADSGKHRKKNKGFSLSSVAAEVLILEFISVFVYFLSLRVHIPDSIVLLAVLMPVIVGIGARMAKQQLTLREAASKCRLHIILTCFVLVCIILCSI